MRKKSVNTLLVFGVVVAIILLMIWLFLGTTLVEDTSTEISPVPIEQATENNNIKRRDPFGPRLF